MPPRTYRKQQEAEEDRQWVSQLVSSAQTKEWYGDMTIKFAKGEVVHVNKLSKMVPPRKAGRR